MLQVVLLVHVEGWWLAHERGQRCDPFRAMISFLPCAGRQVLYLSSFDVKLLHTTGVKS